ncbi:MAG: GTP 3',8-cyclase MoaA [Nitrososphaeria archaeon]
MLIDRFFRVAEKLRLSVTDKCNYRCVFCMPSTPEFADESELMTLDEIKRVLTIFRRLGVKEVKLTGGEPLLRNDVLHIVSFASELFDEVSMTTNGYYLERLAADLRKRGLKRVNISLHSLKPDKYRQITGIDGLKRALEGIEAAKNAGFEEIKVNVTLIRRLNDDEIFDYLEFSRSTGVTVRFLEYEPFDGNWGWRPERVVSSGEVLRRISSRYRLSPIARGAHSTTKYYFIDEIGVKFGVISSVTEPFCSDCNRVRVTADGVFLPCMYSLSGPNLKNMIREGKSDEEIISSIKQAYFNKFEGVIKYVKENAMPEAVKPMYKLGG